MKAYSEEKRQEIIDLFSSGKSVTEIATETEISHVTVRAILSKAGVDLPDKKRRRNDDYYNLPETVDRLVMFYKSGMTIKDIVAKEKIAAKTVRRILIGAGVYHPQAAEKEKNANKASVSDEEFIRIWQTSRSVREVETKTGLSRQAVNIRSHSMRKHGVPLKKMERVGKDWSRLIELAKQFEEK